MGQVAKLSAATLEKLRHGLDMPDPDPTFVPRAHWLFGVSIEVDEDIPYGSVQFETRLPELPA